MTTPTLKNTRYVYKIRDKRNGKFFAGYSSFDNTGKEFKGETSAKSALGYLVTSTLGRRLWQNNERISKETIAKNFPYDLEIVKVEMVLTEKSTISLSTHVDNLLICQKLSSVNNKFAYFWEQAIRKDFADQIEYVFLLNQVPGKPYMEMVKEARSCLRNLGVKTRTFREYNGCFGFYSKDQALKARLTLDVKDFIDITELRTELLE
jgi:hypothetical protein